MTFLARFISIIGTRINPLKMSNLEKGIGVTTIYYISEGTKQALSYSKKVGMMTLALLANAPTKAELSDGNIPVNTAVSGFWHSPKVLVGNNMHSNRSLNFSFQSLPNAQGFHRTRNVMFFNAFTASADTSFGAPVASAEGYTPNFTGQCNAEIAKVSGCDWVDDPEGKYTIDFNAAGLKDCDPLAFTDKNRPRNCAVESIGNFQAQFHSCDVMTIREDIIDINTGDASTVTYNMIPLLADTKGCEIITNANLPETVNITTATGIANLSTGNGLAVEVSSFEPDVFDENGEPLGYPDHPLIRDKWTLNIVDGSIEIDGIPLPAGHGVQIEIEDFQAPYFWAINFKAMDDIDQYLQRAQTMTFKTFYTREGNDGQSRPARTEDRTFTITWQ